MSLILRPDIQNLVCVVAFDWAWASAASTVFAPPIASTAISNNSATGFGIQYTFVIFTVPLPVGCNDGYFYLATSDRQEYHERALLRKCGVLLKCATKKGLR
jgi:hypothetical protein